MAKNIEFNVKSVSEFINWLKRFASINDALLLEIDKSNNEFIAKTYNEEKSVVKFSKLSFNDGNFEPTSNSSPNQRLKFGIHSLKKLTKTLSHFSDGEFKFIFKYDKLVENDSSETLSGTSMLLKNNNLKVNINCTPLNIFKYIGDELIHENIANTESLLSFNIQREMIEKIVSLISLDTEYKYLKFLTKEKKIYAKSKSFEYVIEENSKGKNNVQDEEIEILKDQFSKIDVENYKCSMGEDRIVLHSIDSETITVLSEVEKNDSYEESEEEEFD